MEGKYGEHAFWIDKRFKISETTNEIIKIETGSEVSIKVEPILMAVLVRLVLANGSIVSRAFLLENIWMNYEGGEDGLNQAISKLRKIFDDDPKAPKVIETIPKKGYRIIAPIEKEQNDRLVKVKRTFRESEVSQMIALIDYLKQPKHFTVFLFLAAFATVVLYFLYKIIYAIVWSQ
jgi:DNA-binding winged helix-turn-helix (wHTH) protein